MILLVDNDQVLLRVLYNLLNIKTTAMVLAITLIVIFWLYRIRKRALALATI